MAYIINSLKNNNKKIKNSFMSDENKMLILVVGIAIIIGIVDYMLIIKFLDVIKGI